METSIYQPVKAFLEGAGYTVRVKSVAAMWWG
jgi:hypothetical protein